MPCFRASAAAISGRIGSIRVVTVVESQVPVEDVHRLDRPAASTRSLVVRRVPRLADHRLELEALDQHAALLVDDRSRTDRSCGRGRCALQPGAAASSSASSDLLVVLELEEAEEPQRLPWNSLKSLSYWALIAPDDATVAPRQEELGVAVLEERVQLAVEVGVALELERRDPGRARDAAGRAGRRTRFQVAPYPAPG